MTVLEKKLNTVREPLGDKVGFKIKSEKVKIPYADLDVTVSIRIWPSPRGSPKMWWKELVTGHSFSVCCLLS